MEAIEKIQHFTNRVYFGLVAIHAPLASLIGWIAGWREWWVYGTSHLLPVVVLLWYYQKYPKNLTEKHFLTAGMLPGLAMFLIYISRGTPWQNDLHLYFFVILAVSTFTFQKSILLTAGVSITLYYLIASHFWPYFIVSGNEAYWPSIALHIGFVMIQSVLGFCIIHIAERTLKKPGKAPSRAASETRKASPTKKAMA